MEDQTTLVRHTIKDSVFTTLFRQVIYALELYRALHPEDTTVTVDDCKIITIERVLSTGIYNDFGLLVRNHLIFLMEAQSTFSPNMPYRMLGYLSITYKDFVEAQEGMNPFSDAAIRLPRPEPVHGTQKEDSRYAALVGPVRRERRRGNRCPRSERKRRQRHFTGICTLLQDCGGDADYTWAQA